MKLVDRINSFWAIPKADFDPLLSIVKNHLGSPKVSLTEADTKQRASAMFDASGNPVDYQILGDTGIIYISGIILQRPSSFERWLFDAIGTDDIQNAVDTLMNSAVVSRIIMFISSPGGTVPGVDELSSYIFSCRGKGKEIIAFTDNVMASAAYWIGSAADKIFISGETTRVGSIGVYTTHMDWSEYLKSAGVTVTNIYAGKYKTAGSPYQPLDDDSKAYIQAGVDHTYTIFVNAVARNRGVTPEQVIVNMADGRVFNGSEAITAHLVDGVSTFDALMGGFTPDIPGNNDDPGDGESDPGNNNDEEEAMSLTKDQLIKENKALYDDIIADGKASASAVTEDQLAAARAEGAKTELDRVKGVKMALIPGYEKEIDEMIMDGKTTPGEAALKITSMERSLRAERAGAQNPAVSAGGDPDQNRQQAATGTGTIEEQAKANWAKDTKLHEEYVEFEDYLAVFKREKERG